MKQEACVRIELQSADGRVVGTSWISTEDVGGSTGLSWKPITARWETVRPENGRIQAVMVHPQYGDLALDMPLDSGVFKRITEAALEAGYEFEERA